MEYMFRGAFFHFWRMFKMNRLTTLSIVFLAVLVASVQGFAENAVINLGPEEIVKADGNDIVVPGYSVPSFEDWNNDNLKDLIVGEGGGTTTGKVRVYLNVGTESNPIFINYFYAQAGGKDLTCTPQGCMGCFPRVVYWDQDERIDLLVGLSDGTAKIFLNITDNNAPAFDAGTSIQVGVDPASNLDVGSRATPILVHWNEDDDMLDLVAGALDGSIHIYYNCGCGGSVPPHFNLSPVDGLFAEDDGNNLRVPSDRSSPVFLDLDGDGKKDLLTGNTNGQILFYKNVTTDSIPAFSGYSFVQSNGVDIDLVGTPRSRPFVCNWNDPNDGYWDLLVGAGDGKVRLYRGIPKQGDLNGDGVIDGADFTILAMVLDQTVTPENYLADLNKDGVVDILDLIIFLDLWLGPYGGTDVEKT
jgi:hypothetical protein